MNSTLWRRLTRRLGPRALGLEITDTALKAAEASDGTPPVLYNIGSVALQPGVVEEGRIVNPKALSAALRELKGQMKVKSMATHIVLPSALVVVRSLSVPDVPRKAMRRVLDFELKFNIPLPFERPHYDFIRLPTAEEVTELPAGEAGEDAAGFWQEARREAAAGDGAAPSDASPKLCEVMLAAASLDSIESYETSVRACGLQPVSMEIKAMSLFRVVRRLTPVDPAATFVAIDLTETYADVSIFHGGALRITRNKPIRFPPTSAGPGSDGGQTANADWAMFEWRSACQELAAEVDRFLNYYRYSLNHREQQFQAVIVTGDVDSVPEIAAYLRERLPHAVVSFQLESPALAVSDPKPAEFGSLGPRRSRRAPVRVPIFAVPDSKFAGYTAVCGAALRGRAH